MRRLLVLFALVGLLYSPAVTAAAQQACAQAGPGMAAMAMPAAAPDPCCDHSHKAPDAGKACTQACATMCGIVGALPAAVSLVSPPRRAFVVARTALPLEPHPPPRMERPPRPDA